MNQRKRSFLQRVVSLAHCGLAAGTLVAMSACNKPAEPRYSIQEPTDYSDTELAQRAAKQETQGLGIGAQMPMAQDTLLLPQGGETTLAKHKGNKGTLVVFTCNHCPYAIAWETRLTDIGNKAQSEGFGVVAINANDPGALPEDGPEEMIARAKKLRMQFPYVIDKGSHFAHAFGAKKTPEVYLFDAKDMLQYHGAIDDNYTDATQVTATYLQDALDAVQAGQPVERAETKALGCGIKYYASAM